MNSIRGLAAGFGLGLLLAIVPSCGAPKTCNPTTCSGCCDATGACQSGVIGDACGASGNACTACTVAQTCSGGFCLGGGGGGGGDGGSTSGNIDAFCSSIAEAYCSYLVTCKQLEATRKPDCVGYLDRYYCLSLGEASVEKSYRNFNGAQGSACVASIQASSCSDNSALYSGPCTEMFSPNSGTGQGCFEVEDCKVAGELCGGSGCAKTCQPTGGLNQLCRGTACNTGFYCETSTSLCRAPKPPGSTCTSNTQCDGYCDTAQGLCAALPTNTQPCRTTNPYCASGTYCDFAAVPDTCRSLVGVGGTCTSTSDCVSGNFCLTTTSPATCQPKRGAGGACSTTSQCLPDFYCSSASLCTARGGPNQPCVTTSQCQADIYCDGIYKSCNALSSADAGAPCTNSTIGCKGPTVCKGVAANPDGGVGTSGICGQLNLGESCTGDGFCPTASYCQRPDGGTSGSGLCQAGSLGSRCASDDNCPSSQFCSSTKTCAVRSGTGQPCLVNYASCTGTDQCRPGGADGGAATCRELGDTNSACFAAYGDCKALLECIGSVCTSVARTGSGPSVGATSRPRASRAA